MKKCLSFFIAFAIVINVIPIMAVTSNTEAVKVLPNFIAPITLIDPDCPEMNWIAISDRAGLEAITHNMGGNFYLTADIDLGGAIWSAIYSWHGGFTGTFDGQGHVIRNMTIRNNPSSDFRIFGLFGYVNGATIRNFGLENMNIDVAFRRFDYSSVYIGGIVGEMYGGSLDNVYTTGRINVVDNGGRVYVGGLVGVANFFDAHGPTTITNSYNAADISVSPHAHAHGGRVVADAGGILGVMGSFTTIANCFNTGNITFDAVNGNAGGILGRSDISSGFVPPFMPVDITNSFNSGDILILGASHTSSAGIFPSTGVRIANSYNTGSLTGNPRPGAGTVTGLTVAATIETSYNAGTVNGRVADGTNLDFTGFDFENTWVIIDAVNNGLPILRVHRDWHIAQLSRISRNGETAECWCGVHKQWRYTQREEFDDTLNAVAITTMRRSAKRDTGGNLLESCGHSLTFGGGELLPPHRIITPDMALIAMQSDHIFLDVRTPEEFEEQHISGAVLVPYDEIGARAVAEFPDKHALILIYCRSGRRSNIAMREMADLGFTNVFDIGGMQTFLDYLSDYLEEQK
jgi:rhodanese-related sulfurtransferase